MTSLLLSTATWDLTLDGAGNEAVGTEPDVLAQEAACAIQLWLGEYYFDTTKGVSWLQRVFGVNPPPPTSILKQLLISAALAANGDIAAAQVFFSSFTNRAVQGQVQVVSVSGQTAAAPFSAFAAQGGY